MRFWRFIISFVVFQMAFPLLALIAGLVALGAMWTFARVTGMRVDESAAGPFVICPTLFVLVGAFLYGLVRVNSYLDARADLARSRAVEALARRMGWTFRAQADDLKGSLAETFPAFSVGAGGRVEVRNLSEGRAGESQVKMFDLRIVIRRSNGPSVIDELTVILFQSDALSLPAFSLSSWERRFADPTFTLGWKLGLKQLLAATLPEDINFAAHPRFSENYQLTGNDESSVRALFTPALLSFYENIPPGACTLATGDRLAYFRPAQLITESNAQALFGEAFYVLTHLRRSRPAT